MNFMKTLVAASVAGAMMVGAVCAQEDSLRPREYGIQFGVLQPARTTPSLTLKACSWAR